ncbi:Rpn family recombination-promoting nuclease/putative transposase [Armatimonas sp.]|uniref:Rpn family recombination-promoting nuclease/putative transposase n=1 Tax=Armatimonas sp. TaxID=1872638 RepID=UPI00374CEB7D
MPTPFDATTKELVRFQPEDWLALLGLPPEPCELVDTDLATVSTEVDRLIQVNSAQPYLVHIEFQAGHDGHKVPGRMLRYNVLAADQTDKTVLSYVILLRPEADSPSLTGFIEKMRPNGTRYLTFEYEVVRLWKLPVASVLRGGLATLPLALLCDLSATTPENVVTSMETRIELEAKMDERRKLWTSTYLLAGVRYSPEIAGKLLEKAVAQMKESMTYQKILADGREEGIETGKAIGRDEGKAEGKVDGERLLFLKVSRPRLGEPDAKTLAVINAASSETIELWADNLNRVESWSELIKV